MGIQIPDQSPKENPLSPILINRKWLPILLGLIYDNLLLRNYWAGTEGEIDDVIDDVDDLIYILSGTVKEVSLLGLIDAEWLLQGKTALFEAYDSGMLLASFDPASPDSPIPLKRAGVITTLTIDSVGTSTQQIGYSSGSQLWVSQSFSITEGYLSQFKVNFSTNVGSPTGNIAWEIRSDSSGSPSILILDSGTFTPTPNTDNTITVNNGVYLASGVTYWLVLKCEDNQTSGNAYRVRVNVANPYAGGVIKITTDSGSSWQLNGAGSTDIRLTITTITEYEITKLAQAMLPDSSGELDTIEANLAKVGTPTGNLVFKLYSDYQGEPSTLLATSDSASVASLSTSFTWELFTFSTPYSLVENTLYWLVLESTHTPSSTNYIEWQGVSNG